MLTKGIFSDRHGVKHMVYIIETIGYYRIDIAEEGSQFMSPDSNVEYSHITRIKTFVYGDRELYRDFTELKRLTGSINCALTTKNEWRDGSFFITQTREDARSGINQTVVLRNGQFDNSTTLINGRMLILCVESQTYNSKIAPLNFSEYVADDLPTQYSAVSLASYYSLRTLQARFDIAHIDKCDFVVADTIELARERLARYDNAGAETLRGFDTETTGLDVDMHGEDKLVGIVLSCGEDESAYFPFRHAAFDNLPTQFMREIAEIVQKHKAVTIAHNKKFDRKVMLKEGFDIRIKYDTMVMSFLINPVIKNGAHALKSLVGAIKNKRYLELEDVFTSRRMIDFSTLPKDIVRVYACPDASNVIALYRHLDRSMPNHLRPLFEIECALADLKAEQEYYGLRVDISEYVKNKEKCDRALAVLEKAFRAVTQIDGKITSTQVLSDLIYNKMGCPVLACTKTGRPSTGKKVIEKLSKKKRGEDERKGSAKDITDGQNVLITAQKLNEAKYPALVILEAFRHYNKLQTAFYNRFERTTKSGRIFFWINQNGAASGRQSSPMHQLPPELKKVIIADSGEYDFYDPDYSRVELRMIAFLAGEKDLIELCRDSDNDIHRAIGALISGKEMWEISADERKSGKSRNFGVVYMMSEYGLANSLYGAGSGDDKAKVAAAKKLIDEFYTRFRRIRQFVADNGRIVRRDGKIHTYFGRVRLFPEIHNPDITAKKRASIVRQANNTPVQGTAADYLKIGEVNLAAYIRNKGWDTLTAAGLSKVQPALSIHDEVIIMAHKSIPSEEILLMIRECMERPIPGAPPFFCSPSLVHDWHGHDEDSTSMPIKLRDKLIEKYQKTGVSAVNNGNWESAIKAYRKELLTSYMDGLIAECGTNAQAIADRVRHPTLTHDLLAAYKPPYGFSHEKSILYAVEKYLKSDLPTPAETAKIAPPALPEFADLETLVNFDRDGNIVYEDGEDDADSTEILDDAEVEAVEKTAVPPPKVWEIGNTLCIDLSGLDLVDADKILAEIWQFRRDDGFFDVQILANGKLISAGFRVEELPKKAISEIIEEAYEKCIKQITMRF